MKDILVYIESNETIECPDVSGLKSGYFRISCPDVSEYTEPVKIIEILRLTEMKLNQRDIGIGAGCSKSTVGEIQKRIRDHSLTYEKALTLTDSELLRLLYPASQGKQYRKPEPNFAFIHEELTKHPTLNLRYLWEEYKTQDPLGLEYSQFCERYNLPSRNV